MSEEQLEYDPEWTLATLNDAKEALEDLIAQVEDSQIGRASCRERV